MSIISAHPDISAALRSGTLLLDAAMGSALLAQGLEGRAPAWNLSHPENVLGIHSAHVAAGAELVLTNTFVGATAEEAAAAIRLARESGAKYVAGSLWAGLADLEAQVKQLEDADAIWLESAVTAEQALAAVQQAAAVTRLPIVVTCAMRSAPLRILRDAGAIAAGYNCTPWPEETENTENIGSAGSAGSANSADHPDIVKPDAAGIGDPHVWAAKVPRARLRGGCCGTDARYVAALRATAR